MFRNYIVLILVALDADLGADIQALKTKGSQNVVSLKNLQTLAKAASDVRQRLDSFLGAPLSAMNTRFATLATAYSSQKTHASNVSGNLDSLASSSTLAARIKTLIAVEPSIAAEALPDMGFNVLANEISKLDAAMVASIASLKVSFANICNTLSTDLTAAGAIPVTDAGDKALITTINGLQSQCASAAASGKVDHQAAAVEAVRGALNGVPVINSALQTRVTAIFTEADNAFNQGNTQITAIAGSELHTSSGEQALIDSVHNAVQLLEGQLSEPLRQQQQDILAARTTIDTNKNAAGAGPILKARLDELILAFTTAVGSDAMNGIDSRIAAHAIPAFPNDPEKTHANKLRKILSDVTAEPDVLKHIGLADAALPLLDLELQSIQTDLTGVGDAACFTDAGAELQPVLDKFRSLWTDYIQVLETLYNKRIPAPIEFGDPYVHARASLFALIVMIRTIAMSPGMSLTAMVKLGTDFLAGMPTVLTPAETPWFNDLKKDLNDEISKATASADPTSMAAQEQDAFGRLGDIAIELGTPPAQSAKTILTLKDSFKTGSDTVARSLIALNPSLGTNLYDGWRSQKVGGTQADVYALRVHGSLFGSSAARPVVTTVSFTNVETITTSSPSDLTVEELPGIIHLDTPNDRILPDSWVVLLTKRTALPFIAKAVNPSVVAPAKYGLGGKSTAITLSAPWFTDAITDFNIIRTASVYALSEKLTLSERPVDDPVGNTKGVDPSKLELDNYYDGVVPGRSVVVTGERLDVAGVVVSEVAEIAAVSQIIDENLPGDTIHTTLTLSTNLQYGYKRATVKINANVAPATNGETQKEVLGSGDGAQTFQNFRIKHLPLTWLSQPTPSGAQSTLQVRVNDVLWHEADNLAFLGTSDRGFATSIEDDGTTNITFGDGIHGARIPTGTENVRAVYRSGIGEPGNVPAGQIGILPSPPLGVTAVNNPAPATGGADAESRDQARRNVPLAVQALDRLVSVKDYADFARTYAGIAKANATLQSGTVSVVIAGMNDIPISKTSDLFFNLRKSMKSFGDPHQPFTLDIRKLKLLAMSAKIAVDPDYDPVLVTANVTNALLAQISFDARELGQHALLSEVIRIMQAVAGVVYIDVDQFGFIPETLKPDEVVAQVAGITDAPPRIVIGPGEIAYFSPSLPETLVLNAISPEAGQ